MKTPRRFAPFRGWLVGVLAAALLTGGASPASGASMARFVPPAPAILHPAPPAPLSSTMELTVHGEASPGVPATAPPAALIDGDPDLRAGPSSVPLQLQIPAIGVSSQVLGVGLTRDDAMEAPVGRAADAVWQQAFWYRGSAVPGELSTAVIAAHVSDSLGRPGPFARLAELRPGDVVVARDLRTGTDTTFAVTHAEAYSLAEAAQPAVLTEMYGAGPVAGTPPQPSHDGRAHLTLVTCTGTFRNGTHDHRLVVSAVRVA